MQYYNIALSNNALYLTPPVQITPGLVAFEASLLSIYKEMFSLIDHSEQLERKHKVNTIIYYLLLFTIIYYYYYINT